MAMEKSDIRGPGMKGVSGGQYGDRQQDNSAIRTACLDAAFDFDSVPPDIGPYVLADDVLQVTVNCHTNLTAVVNYAILTRDSGLVLGQERCVTTGGNSGSLFSFQLREGFLLSATITPSASVGSGNYCWATMGIRRLAQSAQNVYQVLGQGYALTIAPLSFPGSGCVVPSASAGIVRVITGATPGAGADISEAVPSGKRWQLLALRASLTTAVAVANRQPQLLLDDGASVFYQTPQGPNQAASLVWAYQFAPLGVAQIQTNLQVEIQYDNAQMLEASFRIRTLTAAIQGADQWTAPVYAVREWQGQF